MPINLYNRYCLNCSNIISLSNQSITFYVHSTSSLVFKWLVSHCHVSDSDSLSVRSSFGSNLHLQCTVGGVDQCGTVDLAQNQQSAHLMSLQRRFQKIHFGTKRQCLTMFNSPTGTTKDFLPPNPSQDEPDVQFTTLKRLAWRRGVPCCRPGAGQCSRSHPAASGQPWPGEGGWLHDRKRARFIVTTHIRIQFTCCCKKKKKNAVSRNLLS